MKIAISRTLVNMNPELSDTGSIAGIFVDVDGIRRGMNRTAVFRTIKGDNLSGKAAFGKSRRLMSSCIKKQQTAFKYISYSSAQLAFSTYTLTSPNLTPRYPSRCWKKFDPVALARSGSDVPFSTNSQRRSGKKSLSQPALSHYRGGISTVRTLSV